MSLGNPSVTDKVQRETTRKVCQLGFLPSFKSQKQLRISKDLPRHAETRPLARVTLTIQISRNWSA